MAIFRKVYPRCWQSMIGLTPTEKTIALYILSGPQTNRCGIYQFSIGKAIEDIETLPQTFQKGFDKVLKHLDWKYDKRSRIVYIPTWWKWNQPENPNVLIGNLKDIDELPYSPLISEFYTNTKYLSDNLIKTFMQTLPQTLPQTVVESEAVTEAVTEEINTLAPNQPSIPIKINKSKGINSGFDTFWHSYPKKKAKGKAEKAWLNAIKLPDFSKDKILEALEFQKQSADWTKDNGQFIPFPSTWLNQKRWLDEIKSTEQDPWAAMTEWGKS